MEWFSFSHPCDTVGVRHAEATLCSEVAPNLLLGLRYLPDPGSSRTLERLGVSIHEVSVNSLAEDTTQVLYSFDLQSFSSSKVGDMIIVSYDFFFFCLYFFFFLGLQLWHMEVPRPGVKSELQLPACTAAAAVLDP